MTVIDTATDIATSLGITETELYEQALLSFLREKKRQTLQLQLEMLSRYGVTSTADLEAKITDGSVADHPAWEDLIVAENLAAHLTELNAYLNSLQHA